MANPNGEEDNSGVKRKLEEHLGASGAAAPLSTAAIALPQKALSSLLEDLANTQAGKPSPTKKLKLEDQRPSGEEQEEDDDEDEDEVEVEVLNAAQLGVEGLCEVVLEWTDTDAVLRLSVIQRMVEQSATGDGRTLGEQALAESSLVTDGQTVLEYMNGQLATQLERFPSATSAFPEGGMSGVLDVDQDETECVCDAAIGTTGMEPCIAVGLTVEHAGHRYNAMHHFSDVIPIADVMDELLEKVNERKQAKDPGSGNVDFARARYFAAGGTSKAVLSMRHVAAALAGRNAVVHFTKNPDDATRGKSAQISATGEFSWQFED